VSIPANCGSCRRELLLDQLLRPSEGFRCPFCGFAFAPSYATLAPGVARRILESHDALVRALGELQSMVDGRLLLDRSAVVAPVADALPTEPQPA
jgi:LSD1 subclass zinc finger protein